MRGLTLTGVVQCCYRQPKPLPAGTPIRCVGRYDNSAANRWNPNPARDVPYGEQTWDDMLNGIMEVALAPQADATRVFRNVPPERAAEARVRR